MNPVKADPIVAEVRRIRAELLEEAHRDLGRLAEMICESATAIPLAGPGVRTAEELRRVVEQKTCVTPPPQARSRRNLTVRGLRPSSYFTDAAGTIFTLLTPTRVTGRLFSPPPPIVVGVSPILPRTSSPWIS